MDFLELLWSAIAADENGVPKPIIARLHFGGNPQKSTQVDVAGRFDAEFVEFDALESATRRVADDHAGVEGSQEILLRIRELVGATEFERLVDSNGEIARQCFPADRAAGHARVGPGAATPVSLHFPVRHALRGIPGDAIDRLAQRVGVDSVGQLVRCVHGCWKFVRFGCRLISS